MTNNRNKYNVDYFIEGLERNAAMKGSPEIAQSICEKPKGLITGIGSALKKHFHYRSKREPINQMHPTDVWPMHYKSHLKRS